MSTSQASLEPAWKQEVNRRLAAHKSRKSGSTAPQPVLVETRRSASSVAAQAAARVAARYAKAPSYSEMLADEARAAVRAAEAASRAALEAQAAAESVLAGIEAASDNELVDEPVSEPVVVPVEVPTPKLAAPVRPPQRPRVERQPQALPEPLEIRWEPDMPVRPLDAPTHESLGRDGIERPADDWWEPAPPEPDPQGIEAIEPVEPAQPIFANLIEFPREIVATRKVRPRLMGTTYAGEDGSDGQLSIFEVDPGTLSTEPAPATVAADLAQSAWAGAEWSGMELDAHPVADEELPQAESAQPEPADAALHQASFGLRSLAAVVDGALITGAGLAAVVVAAVNVKALPGAREIELGAAAAMLVIGVVYHAFFFTLAEATPGMKYAHISLCTFDDQIPTRRQRCNRLGALLLSLLPVGLGVAWAIFDEDHLSWHDRLSKTYQRKN